MKNEKIRKTIELLLSFIAGLCSIWVVESCAITSSVVRDSNGVNQTIKATPSVEVDSIYMGIQHK